MAMGRLSDRGKVAWSGSHLAVALAPRHYFYDRCNEVLAEAEFDEAVAMLCQPYYKEGVGRPSIPPGRYFRMLFVGQFEGLESEREIAWRCADSLSLEGVELKFIDLQFGCAYMYVYSIRGRTLSDRSSLKKMEDMMHE